WMNYWKSNWPELQKERETERKKGRMQPSLNDFQPENFQVHIIHYLPPFAYYRFDDLAMLGLFSRLEECRDGPQLETQLHRIDDRGSSIRTVLGRALLDEFQAAWKDSQELELPDTEEPDIYTDA